MSNIILICGPTATGKTKLSIHLAQKLNAEIINADSTYIYKEPTIATAKITSNEMQGIKHHMINIISLNDDYSIYSFQKQGRKVINELLKENKNIIIIGGSGLYIKALLYNYELEEENKKSIDLSEYNNSQLKAIADKINPNNDIHTNNRQRLERYIKYNLNTNKIMNKTNKNEKIYNFISIGLNTSREKLYENINNRVEEMFKNGLVEEANRNKHYKNFKKIIGYKELDEYFNNKLSLEEAKNLIKQNTRRYAKRQLTWINNQMSDIKWFDINYNNFNETINNVEKYLKTLIKF